MVNQATLTGGLSCLLVAVGCNAIFGLDEGKPRPPVASAGSAGKGGAASGASGRGGAGNAPGSGGDSGEGGELSAGSGGKAGAGAGGVGGKGGTGGAGAGAGGAGAGGTGGAGTGGVGGAGGAAGGNAGTAPSGGEGGQASDPRPVASVWALWKMPNPAGSGLPNPAEYDTQTAGVVLDKVTGLIWERTLGSTALNWDDAVTYCNDLDLAGFDDYRVPSRIELVSIVDFTVGPPTIDPVAFPDAPEDLYWTTSPWPPIPTAVYIVHFGGAYTSVSDRMATTTLRVRCVR